MMEGGLALGLEFNKMSAFQAIFETAFCCYCCQNAACPIGLANEGYMYGAEIYTHLAREVARESFVTNPIQVLIFF